MKRIKIYLAAPMFSEAELSFNKKVAEYLRMQGFDVFLPQESGYKLAELLKDTSAINAHKLIFQKDWEKVKECDILVFILDGRVPDEGGCVELGAAYAYGKECVGLKTDPRSLIEGQINPMILGCLKFRVAKSLDELANYLNEIVKTKVSENDK